jgi:hypothetical protein
MSAPDDGKKKSVTWKDPYNTAKFAMFEPAPKTPSRTRANPTGTASDAMHIPVVSHAQSKTWNNPHKSAKEDLTKLNHHRRQFCPDSAAWPIDYDLPQHRILFAADVNRRTTMANIRKATESALRRNRNRDAPAPPKPSVVQLNPHVFSTCQSTLLGIPTVFATNPAARGPHMPPLADWPSAAEMQYEGDDRIKTEKIHGRALPLPRSLAGNPTVSWQARPPTSQFPFEDYHQPKAEPEVFVQNHFVGDLEPTDEEAVELLGESLIGCLNE